MRNLEIEPFHDDTCEPRVRGFLHRPAVANGDALVLTHGAGGDCHSPLLMALAASLAENGMTVLRCDLPFRQRQAQGPPRPGDAARDREGLRQALAAIRKIISGRIFLGGHSYGGRQASLLAADDPGIAAGLLLLSYPLHPPRRPTQLRKAHFSRLRVPALFVAGTRDGFASLEEITSALQLIPSPTRLLTIEGADHSLARHNALPTVAARVRQAFLELIA